jgi:hypothetical protein
MTVKKTTNSCSRYDHHYYLYYFHGTEFSKKMKQNSTIYMVYVLRHGTLKWLLLSANCKERMPNLIHSHCFGMAWHSTAVLTLTDTRNPHNSMIYSIKSNQTDHSHGTEASWHVCATGFFTVIQNLL